LPSCLPLLQIGKTIGENRSLYTGTYSGLYDTTHDTGYSQSSRKSVRPFVGLAGQSRKANDGRRGSVHHLPRHQPAAHPIRLRRGDSGLAHIVCLARAAASQQAQRGSVAWQQCQTCKQRYKGAMQTGLAEAWRSRVAGQAAESDERIAAEYNLASSLVQQGKAVEAEPMLRNLHEVEMRVLGAEHPNTLTTASRLAWSLSNQGKYADAVRIEREVLGVQKRVLGAEHPDTLSVAGNLALSLSRQGKYVEAERIHCEVAAVHRASRSV
jgi:hypothetical protein